MNIGIDSFFCYVSGFCCFVPEGSKLLDGRITGIIPPFNKTFDQRGNVFFFRQLGERASQKFYVHGPPIISPVVIPGFQDQDVTIGQVPISTHIFWSKSSFLQLLSHGIFHTLQHISTGRSH